MKTNLIFLIGMPASGKSTFGKKLAKQLGWQFLDTDTLIEKRENASIPTIFQSRGEAYFREVERAVLQDIDTAKTVIATGGGMPCFFDNMKIINQKGTSVFLDVPTEMLAQRVLKQQGSRPLLPENELAEVQRSLHEKREKRLPFYRQAALTLAGATIKVGTLIDRLNE